MVRRAPCFYGRRIGTVILFTNVLSPKKKKTHNKTVPLRIEILCVK